MPEFWTKPYDFIGFGDIYAPKPYDFIGFGDIYAPKPCEFIGFGDIYAPTPYKFIRGIPDPGTLCYAIVLPGRKWAFRAGFWPDCYRESTNIGSPAGLRPAGGPILVLSR